MTVKELLKDLENVKEDLQVAILLTNKSRVPVTSVRVMQKIDLDPNSLEVRHTVVLT